MVSVKRSRNGAEGRGPGSGEPRDAAPVEGTTMKLFLTACAFMGILIGKALSAFSQGFDHGIQKNATNTDLALRILSDQNSAMVNHLIDTHSQMLKELVYSDEDDNGETQVMAEVTCRNEHIELIRHLVDEDAEMVIKETASWASAALGAFQLKLKNVALEPDRPSESTRDNDVLLIFNVLGKGENALRFQAEASRKLRDVASRIGGQSSDMLRAEVRWSNY